MLYKESRELFRNQIANPTETEQAFRSYYFALFSANINRFLPKVNNLDYKKMFFETLYSQNISSFEQNSKDYLHASTIIDNTNKKIANGKVKNTIFVTFHLGSYKTPILYLYEKGYKIVLIVDERPFMEKKESYLFTINNLTGKDSSDMIILNIKDRKAIFKIKKLLSKGYVLAVYLDGNTGIKDEAQNFDKGYISINFFNKQIYVKNGISKLANLFNASIIPVISHRDKNENSIIEFHEEITNISSNEKEDININLAKQCWLLFEKKLKLHPTQWEGWGYIHKWFIRDNTTPYLKVDMTKVSRVNYKRYVFFIVNDSHYVFDIFE